MGETRTRRGSEELKEIMRKGKKKGDKTKKGRRKKKEK